MQSFKIAKIIGIPIELHVTFLLLLLAVFYFWGIGGFILYLFLFTSVVLHELGHSYIAKKYGVHIEKILLLPIGGMALMNKIPKNGELKIAIAGPIVSVILGILFIGLSMVYDINILSIENYNYPLFSTVGILNLFLGFFNLLPAFPMDGGRIFRAILSKKMDYLKATKIASSLGQLFALFMLGYAIISLNIILILIAIFIYFGAHQEYSALKNKELFEHIKISNIMNKNIVAIPPETTTEELIDLMLKYKYLGYPVVDNNGELIGTVSFEDIKNKGDDTPVIAIMRKPTVIYENSTFEELLDKLHNDDRVYVLDENNKLIGIISKTDVIRVLKIMGLKNKI